MRARQFEYKGQKYTIKELASLSECVVSLGTLSSRIFNQYMPVEKAMTTPVVTQRERMKRASATRAGKFK